MLTWLGSLETCHLLLGSDSFEIIIEVFRSGKILIYNGKLMSEVVDSTRHRKAVMKGLFDSITKAQCFNTLLGSRVQKRSLCSEIQRTRICFSGLKTGRLKFH